jgi:hypothetical protein
LEIGDFEKFGEGKKKQKNKKTNHAFVSTNNPSYHASSSGA